MTLFFWGVLTLVVGFGLAILLRVTKVVLTWYEWILGIVGLLLLLATIQFYFGSKAEAEVHAANMFLLVTGLPAVILLALAASLVMRRKQVAK